MNKTTRSLLAAALALTLAVPGAAMADRRGGGQYYGHGDRHHDRHGYRHHYRDRHHYYYPGHRNRYYYYRDGHDDDLLLGLVVGGLLGYAIPRYPAYYYDRY
jgi:hypothetical protein